jgi:hypothetical protein
MVCHTARDLAAAVRSFAAEPRDRFEEKFAACAPKLVRPIRRDQCSLVGNALQHDIEQVLSNTPCSKRIGVGPPHQVALVRKHRVHAWVRRDNDVADQGSRHLGAKASK